MRLCDQSESCRARTIAWRGRRGRALHKANALDCKRRERHQNDWRAGEWHWRRGGGGGSKGASGEKCREGEMGRRRECHHCTRRWRRGVSLTCPMGGKRRASDLLKKPDLFLLHCVCGRRNLEAKRLGCEVLAPSIAESVRHRGATVQSTTAVSERDTDTRGRVKRSEGNRWAR
jgi:hypothetical protein